MLLVLFAAFFPMVTIMIVVAVADVSLVGLAFVSHILRAYIRMVFPWIALVHYGFIAVVFVEVAISWWERGGVDPGPILKINILMDVNVIVYICIRHVVITGVVVPNRPPIGLVANVYANAKTHLRISGFEQKTSHQHGCRKN